MKRVVPCSFISAALLILCSTVTGQEIGLQAAPQSDAALLETAAPQATLDILVDAEASLAERVAPKRPKREASTPTRTVGGKLVRRLNTYGPRYPLRLRGASGRIAYVDVSRLFIHDLRPYLEQQVLITGELRPLVPGSRELVIHARSLRLAD